MPIYPYKCNCCGDSFETFQKIVDKPLSKCTSCGKNGLKRQITLTRIGSQFGSGDTTSALKNPDGTPYRFKSGTKKGQMAELKLELEKKELERMKELGLSEPTRTITVDY